VKGGETPTQMGPLDQRSTTGGPLITDGPRENFGGTWRNLDIICNLYVYYTVSLYSDAVTSLETQESINLFQTSSNKYHTHNFVIIKQLLFILIKCNFYDHYFIDVCSFLKKNHVSGPRDSKL
jgi:hypothetical protein